MPKVSDGYDRNVFINCPFDPDYQEVFNALVFATIHCGLKPRCSLEVDNAGEERIRKIKRLIGECRWGIHDISRTQLNENNLPRFNMPLELGLFLGASHYGDRTQKRKSCLVLDVEPYRYQQYISDIAGQDIKAHGNTVTRAIRAVRDWLVASSAGVQPPAGAASITRRFGRFMDDLPVICSGTERDARELTFVEFADASSTWIKTDILRVASA